jgi:DNA-binding transcriptional ArsR family regulator
VSSLRDSLPESWQVDVLSPQGGKDTGRRPVLTVASAGDTDAGFIIEAKSARRGSARDVVDGLRVVPAADSSRPLLFVTEYANPPLRRELEEAGISYLDTTGWACLTSSDPTVLIRLEGANKPPRPRENTATIRLNGPAAARAIRHLLEAQPPLGIRQLAASSSSSPAAVSKLMPTLADAGAVERSADGAITRIRRRTLLDRWTADYSFVNSNGVVLDYIAPRGVVRTLERIRERDEIVVSGSAAAREYLPAGTTSVVPLGLLVLYGADITGIARSLELIRADRSTSNVMITAPRDHTLLDVTVSVASGFRTVPVAQALADLLTLPRGRLAQEAEQLIDTLARDDPSWRE